MKWNLEYLFETPEKFVQAVDNLNSYIDKLKQMEGKLNQPEVFRDFFLLQKGLEEDLGKTYQYAHLKSDLNRKDVANASWVAKMHNLLSQINQAMSWSDPEILSLGEDKVKEFLNMYPEISEFRFSLEKLFRKNKHVLDAKSEKLLSYFSPLSNRGGDLYSSLSVSDNVAKTIRLKDKTKVTVTQGNWRSLIAKSMDASDRKKIFNAIFSYYDEHKTTYGDIYNTVLLTNKANAESRNYPSILESYLFDNNIPTSVFLNLVKVASHENKSLKKYIQLRKEYLGLKEHYTYDRFLELAHSDKTYSYEEAKELFFKSIKHLPKDFQDKAHEVLKDGFVDVYESDGKRTGAYSSSMANLHPFILLNFNNTLDDVFTVAHEAGHSIHSMYAMESQPTMLQDYTIFVAEIASTFNEHMLLDYLIKEGNTTKEEKIMLLQKAIDEIYSTFYRQTLFAEYEYEANKLVENNQPINYEVLSNIMIKLYKKYYGQNIKKEKVKQYVWAYIPHLFYTPFYVYQYATSFAASFKLYKDVKEKKEGAFERYTGLLKSGGSKYPVEQAKDAGVDFTKEETFMAVVERMDDLVSQLEKLIKE